MQKKNNSLAAFFPLIVILACFAVSYCIFEFYLGNSANFVDAEREHPKSGSILAIMFKGGFLVPIILPCF